MSNLPLDFFGMRRVYRPAAKRISAKAVCLIWVGVLALCGSAVSAQGFTVTNSGPLTLESGHFGNFTITVTPIGSVSETTTVNCTTLPANSRCYYPNSSNSLQINNAAATMTILLDTATVYDYESRNVQQHRGLERVALCSLFAPALGLLLLRRRGLRGSPLMRMLVFTLALVPLAGLAGCGNTRPSVTPPGTYPVTVSTTFSGFTATTTFTLTVTP